MGQAEAFISAPSLGLNQDNIEIYWEEIGFVQEYCIKNKSPSSDFDDRQWEHRFLLNNVCGPTTHLVCYCTHEREKILWEGL